MSHRIESAEAAWNEAYAALTAARNLLLACPPEDVASALVRIARGAAASTTTAEEALGIDLASVAAREPAPDLPCLMRAAGTALPQLRERVYGLLVELAHARFGEFMHLTEAGLKGDLTPEALSPCLRALAEVVEEGALGVLLAALDHDAADVTATALGALLEMTQFGDLPDAVYTRVAGLETDARVLNYDLGGLPEQTTVGELAEALLHELTALRADGA